MSRQKIIEITTRILVEEFEVEGIATSLEANSRENLGLDGPDYVDLVVVIQQELGVKLVEADFKEIVTFEDFYIILANKINT